MQQAGGQQSHCQVHNDDDGQDHQDGDSGEEAVAPLQRGKQRLEFPLGPGLSRFAFFLAF